MHVKRFERSIPTGRRILSAKCMPIPSHVLIILSVFTIRKAGLYQFNVPSGIGTMLGHRASTYGSNGSPRLQPLQTSHVLINLKFILCLFDTLLFHCFNFKELHFADSYRTLPILRGRAALTPSVSFLPQPILYLR